MRTLFDQKCRSDVLGRLEKVRPEAQPLWGRMSAPQMLAHLGDQMRMTLGENWAADLATLEELVSQFAARGPGGNWPAHSHFGPLSGRQWGVFCYRHFDHHLCQFGA